MLRTIPSIKLGIQEAELEEILVSMRRVLSSGRLTLGEEGELFEEEFSQFIGVPYACTVNSGTSALEIALRSFDVLGKEVLVPTNTFFATAAAVVHAGGAPRFVDCDPQTLNMDLDSLERRWSPSCAGVIAVHIGGAIVPGITTIQRFCLERGIFLLEDAAHAHGSTFMGRQAGTFGDAATFSFYPTKVMTSGEGGMLLTFREEIYRRALIYRDQGKKDFSSNYHVEHGYNWRMSELHAVVGRSQLRQLPLNLKKRRQIARWYGGLLKDSADLVPQKHAEEAESNYYKYPVLIPKGVSRRELKQRLRAEWQVSLSGEVYEVPCHLQPVFEKFSDTDLPGAEEGCTRHICLPLYPGLTYEDAEYVVNALKATLGALALEVSH